MLKEGRRLLGTDGLHWLCDDATELALKEETFDKVLCFSAFPHFTDHLNALQEMSRVLRSGGKLLILHTSSSEELNAFHASLDGVVSGDRLPEAREMIPLLQQSGLDVEKAVDEQGLFWVEAVKR
jgi:ubiquinone/menaquinone biosynthesis C-methylase UbiE